jgi:antitoxin Phd
MWTLQDAKNRFSSVVDAALAGRPQHVTRRGKAAVVVVSADEFARLNAVAGEFERAPAQPRDVEW